ncbi:septin SHS1 SCDLUD_002997 [Saccharomycodes ludwigii]|uniref:septin SHS1 n=1 Tax=Saccharomycodes ludwigii TaxID=36035 RepID=UPI001E8B2B25|nr:hypothetical protein SCDLUD_002997 [Saccharomycodes ludwigii]KAH3901501.1 hypothetical protein SCDLUD_002997 [Saccharomycodes ludwigii]
MNGNNSDLTINSATSTPPSIAPPSVKKISGKRREYYKRSLTYSVLLVGTDGVGKTTFANNLLETSVFKHQYGGSTSNVNNVTNSEYVRITRPAKNVLFTGTNLIKDEYGSFDASIADQTPGFSVCSTTVEIDTPSSGPSSDANDEVLVLNLLMTRGLGMNLDNDFCFDEICKFLEQQFDLVLAEETRIRRNPKFEDTRIHVVLYFIEPTGHGLKELDVVTMKKLSKYSNVLPIIAKADSLTPKELQKFKTNIVRDLETYNVPVYKFFTDGGDNGYEYSEDVNDDDVDDLETLEENKHLQNLQPFAIICSDLYDSSMKGYYREYSWADHKIKVDDPHVSDLSLLKKVLFGSHLQDFKDTTANFLYENYRSERLSSTITRKKKLANGDGHDTGLVSKKVEERSLATAGTVPENDINTRPQSEAPSLSNFQHLVLQSHTKLGEDDQSVSIEVESGVDSSINSRPDKSQLRDISQTLPYVLQHERILSKKQRLQELEENSARELQRKIEELENKAAALKKREKLLASIKQEK